jgi:hypothetical protein
MSAFPSTYKTGQPKNSQLVDVSRRALWHIHAALKLRVSLLRTAARDMGRIRKNPALFYLPAGPRTALQFLIFSASRTKVLCAYYFHF